MFNKQYGLESAVFKGDKTRTWRADKKPRYEVGEIVAIKQCYKDVCDYYRSKLNNKYLDYIALYSGHAGWRNKMFVQNELMSHHIRITAVKKCRLQDLTDEECIKEGIIKRIIRPFYKDVNAYCFYNSRLYATPKQAFADLIGKLNGKDYWGINPDGYVYEFELVK